MTKFQYQKAKAEETHFLSIVDPVCHSQSWESEHTEKKRKVLETWHQKVSLHLQRGGQKLEKKLEERTKVES